MKFRSHLLSALLGGLVAAAVVLWVDGGPEQEAYALTGAASNEALYWADHPLPATAPLPPLPAATLDLRPAARRATPAVVHVDARVLGRDRATVKALFGREENSGTTGGEGSGVIYSADGYIITNYHVVQAADRVMVTTADRQRFTAEIVGTEPKSDLAVLKVDAKGLPYLEVADSDEAEPGQWVLAVGSPLGLTSTVTAGIVSAKGRSLSILRDPDAIESFIQTDAAVNPGNSGGPLVDAEGRLLGHQYRHCLKDGPLSGLQLCHSDQPGAAYRR